MKVEVFNSNSAFEFKKLLIDFQLDLDIFYQPEFLEIEASNINGEYEIFTVYNSISRQIFIYPYIKISLIHDGDEYFDLTSPYGYAGPYCNDHAFFSACESEFLNYIRKQKIVSEFVRYHFIYNENQFFTQEIQNEHNRTVVIFDLESSWENIWLHNVSQNNRNYTNKFEKDGFVLEVLSDAKELEEFIMMYYQTMQNADAAQIFFFPKEYFYLLFEKMIGKVMIGKITKDKTTYASVLFFISGGIVQPYLNGRNLNNKKLPSSVPLYINLAKWAKNNGLRLLNMGGGRTNSPEDSLFLFKKRLSNQYRDFYIGKRIHNMEVYHSLIDNFINIEGYENYEKMKSKLQFYR